MFMPVDKLFHNLDLPKAILQSDKINIYEASFYDVYQPFCVIEYLISDQYIYLQMSSSVAKYNKLDHPNILKIYYWSCEFVLKGNEKIYKFYFITDHFDKDLKNWLIQRSQSKMFFFERDMYKITRDLASALQYAEGFHVPLNLLKEENLVISNNKIRYIPHIFLSSITQEMSKDLTSKGIYPNLSIDTHFFEKPKEKEAITSAQIQEILKKTNEGREVKSNYNNGNIINNKDGNSLSPKLRVVKKSEENIEVDPKKKNIMSKQMKKTEKSPAKSPSKLGISPQNSRKKIFSEEEEKIMSPNSKFKKEEDEDSSDRIYSFGVLLLMIGILYDDPQFIETKVLNNDVFLQIEKRYGREFLKVVKLMLSKEKEKRPNFQMVYEEILNIIKLKGTEDGGFGNDKCKKKLNSLIRLPNSEYDRKVKFLHCFPELYQKMLFVNLQDKNQVFYEVQELNVDFIIPVEHRTVGIKIKEKTLIFLLGGKNTNNVYSYNPDTKELEQKDNMISNLERRSFGIANLSNMIYVAGGYLDNEITKSAECYDVLTNLWSKISQLNEAVTDLSLCQFGNHSIFKFGGQLQTLTLCQTIEKYDLRKDKWFVIKYTVDKSLNEGFALMRNSLTTQVNENEIIILGGINIYYEGSSKVYVFKIKEIEIKKKENEAFVLNLMNSENKRETEFAYEIGNFNYLSLPTKDSLELCPPVIIDDELYFLQFKKNNHRKLFSLSEEWKEIKDIKW